MNRKKFIKNSALTFFALFQQPTSFWILDRNNLNKTRMKDNFWLWGQNVGSHHVGSPKVGINYLEKITWIQRRDVSFLKLTNALQSS